MRRLVASRSVSGWSWSGGVEAQAYLERRNTNTEARRALKRHLSDTVFQALLADATAVAVDLAEAA
jgi:hypothetical protein